MRTDQARVALAAAVAAVDGVTGHAHRPGAARPGDAWPLLRRLEPSTFGTCTATFDLIICLSGDDESAERAQDRWAVALVDALSAACLTVTAVTPTTYLIGGTDLFVLAVTVLNEVENR